MLSDRIKVFSKRMNEVHVREKKYHYFELCKTKKEYYLSQNIVYKYKTTVYRNVLFFVNQINKFPSLVTWYNSLSFTQTVANTLPTSHHCVHSRDYDPKRHDLSYVVFCSYPRRLYKKMMRKNVPTEYSVHNG